jgi:tRNA threonylcarbamoyladenosine modification (KEOPS) complex  Pcc1 subunit
MRAIISVHTPHITIVKEAIKTEITSAPHQKTETTLSAEENTLVITISSDDIRALRGTFNSCMNWLIAILDSLSL